MSIQEKIAKKIAIVLIIIFAIVVIISSAKIYNMSPYSFSQSYNKLTPKEKKAAKALRKTGELQSKIAGKNRTNGDNKFIEEVEKRHKK